MLDASADCSASARDSPVSAGVSGASSNKTASKSHSDEAHTRCRLDVAGRQPVLGQRVIGKANGAFAIGSLYEIEDLIQERLQILILSDSLGQTSYGVGGPGRNKNMYVVMVTPECAPVAQAGGLGDVVFGLAREVEIRGHAVEIIMPKYRSLRYEHIWMLTCERTNLPVPWFNGVVYCSVWFGFVHDRKCFFIEPHSSDYFFERSDIYLSPTIR